MDFDMIPKTIENRILQVYDNNRSFPPVENIYKWFDENNMKVFKEDIHRVENKLMSLY